MSRASLVLKSAFAGIALSVLTAAFVVVAAMAGASFLLGAFVQFGFPSAYLIDLALPSEIFYQLFPEGGGLAFVGLSVIGSFLQLFAIYAIGSYFLWFARRASLFQR